MDQETKRIKLQDATRGWNARRGTRGILVRILAASTLFGVGQTAVAAAPARARSSCLLSVAR